MSTSTIVVAGATGDLGFRITKALLARHAHVRAVVRRNTAFEKAQRLRDAGAEVKVTLGISSRLVLDYLRIIITNANCLVF